MNYRIFYLSGLLLFHAYEHVAAQSSGCIPPPEGLIAWWRGESTGLDSASTNNGVTMGGILFTNAHVGRGFWLSGEGGDYLELPASVFPMPVVGESVLPFSFEVWFKTSDAGVILGQQNSLPFEPPLIGSVPALYVGTNGILFASMFWNGGDLIETPTPVNDNRFHHAVITCGVGSLRLYLDGQMTGTVPFVQQAYADGYFYQLGTGWSDGWPETPGGWFPFRGVIDEPSVYNRILEPAEIVGLYNAATFGKCAGIGGPGLRHRYSFNSPAGARVVADSVGGANGMLHFYGAPTPFTNGIPDGSSFTGNGELRLAGSNGFVQLPSGLVSSLETLTVEAWVTWNGGATTAWQRIFDFGLSDSGQYASGIGTNYLVLCPARGGTEFLGLEVTTVNPFGAVRDPQALALDGPFRLPIGRRSFVAATYDPVGGEARLYLDGSLVALTAGTFNPLARITDRNNWLGRSQWLRDPFFNGAFDEFRIWQGILGAADVANHYASGPDQPFSEPRPLLQVGRAGNTLTVYWSTNRADGFKLEQAPAANAATWSTVTGSPEHIAGYWRVNLPLQPATVYFRLKK